nr:hypothetical protein [Hymenobacter coccineus]
MKPPCMWALPRMMSQYSWKLPVLLPMAWAYSHMMNGRFLSVAAA